MSRDKPTAKEIREAKYPGLRNPARRKWKWAPYLQACIVGAVLCFISSAFFGTTYLLETHRVDLDKTTVSKGFALEGGRLYNIEVAQPLTGNPPQYSEMEFELLDQDKNHVYSFYKDFWVEKHTDDGYAAVYRDVEAFVDIEVQETGTYYFRLLSHNNQMSPVSCTVFERSAGNLYFKWYGWFFVALLGLGVIAGAAGYQTLSFRGPQLRMRWRNDKAVQLAYFLVILIYGGLMVVSLTHYGYAGAGGYDHAPTIFYDTQNVFYLG